MILIYISFKLLYFYSKIEEREREGERERDSWGGGEEGEEYELLFKLIFLH